MLCFPFVFFGSRATERLFRLLSILVPSLPCFRRGQDDRRLRGVAAEGVERESRPLLAQHRRDRRFRAGRVEERFRVTDPPALPGYNSQPSRYVGWMYSRGTSTPFVTFIFFGFQTISCWVRTARLPSSAVSVIGPA